MTTLPIACGIDGTVQSWDQRYAGLVLAGDSLSLLPLAYGADTAPNLILNGDFATDTVWTKGLSWTIAAGVASVNAPAALSALTQSVVLVAGATYEVTVTVTSYTGGSLSVRLRNSGANVVTLGAAVAAGTFKYTGVLTGAANELALVAPNNLAIYSIDNVILRRIQ